MSLQLNVAKQVISHRKSIDVGQTNEIHFTNKLKWSKERILRKHTMGRSWGYNLFSMKFMSMWLRWALMDVMSIRVVDEENPEPVCQFVRLISIHSIRANICLKCSHFKTANKSRAHDDCFDLCTFNYKFRSQFCQTHEKTCPFISSSSNSLDVEKKIIETNSCQIKSALYVISCGWRW